MSVFVVRLPDVGEGVAEAELVEWCVEVGDRVTTESVLAEVLTDKATVEIACPVDGVVVAVHGAPGDLLAVGAEFVGIETGAEVSSSPPPAAEPPPAVAVSAAPAPPPVVSPVAAPSTTAHALAAPAVRHRARSLGIDLSAVAGSGPDGRVVHADLDRVVAGRGSPRVAVGPAQPGVHVEAVRGLRRRISENLSLAWNDIPHITYVDEVDATQVEALRAELNSRLPQGAARITLLPFLVRALVIACRDQPTLNAHYDPGASTLTVSDALHVGIAAQTPNGLVVPVVRHAEALSLSELATEIARLAEAARSGRATSEELGGSTITVTSLGALGGLMTTPIINKPEVAVIGVNKMQVRPVWTDGAFVPRTMFNLSSSFDHRIVDGWDAATFIQRVKGLLEMPALLFIDGAGRAGNA